jgi:hypothetical protein
VEWDEADDDNDNVEEDALEPRADTADWLDAFESSKKGPKSEEARFGLAVRPMHRQLVQIE